MSIVKATDRGLALRKGLVISTEANKVTVELTRTQFLHD